MRLTYVVLAAGSSSRMKRDKLCVPLAGRSPLDRVARLLAGRSVVLVRSPERAHYDALFPSAAIAVNPAPHAGMTSSFRIAVAHLSGCERAAIVLADTPLLSRSTLERLEERVARSSSDVVYPRSSAGRPGHPVFLAPRAVAAAARLPDGDTLRELRTDVSLSIEAIACEDPGAFIDVDTPEQWIEAERYAREIDG